MAVAWVLDALAASYSQGVLTVMLAPASSGALVSTGPSIMAMVTPLPVYPLARVLSSL